MPLRIAIATATPHDKCETFVAAHIGRLEHVVLVMAGGSLPETDGKGRPLMSSSVAAVAYDRFSSIVLGQRRERRLRARITQLLREAKVDVVLAEYGITAAEILPCCQEAGVPLVPYFLGFDAYSTRQLERYGNYRALFAGAARIVAVSEAIRAHLVTLGAPPEKIVYNSCGADLERFQTCDPRNAPPHFLAVGRFVDKKAAHLALLAFAHAWRQRPDARMTMVGDGPLWESCHQLARAHGLANAVELCGPKPPDVIAQMLQRTRAFVQHSVITSTNDREGTPVAMLEAMGAGVPVISTRHGDIVELAAHGKRGLLSDEADIVAMAEHMVKLIDHPEEAGSMGANAAAYVRAEHGIIDRIASLQAILERAAAERSMKAT